MNAVRAGAVLRLDFGRPERRNALDAPTIAALRGALAVLEADVRLVELTARGPTWCAGADLLTLANDPAARQAATHDFADLLADLVECPVPVLAVVEGAVLGGGVGLLAAADLVVMGASASVCLPEAGIGLWPMMVGALLGRVVSPRLAMELALTGRRLSAEDCARVGLANACGEAAEAVAALLRDAILRRAPAAVRAGRAAWRAHADLEPLGLRERLHALADALGALAEAPEAAEGITALFQKRLPSWASPR